MDTQKKILAGALVMSDDKIEISRSELIGWVAFISGLLLIGMGASFSLEINSFKYSDDMYMRGIYFRDFRGFLEYVPVFVIVLGVIGFFCGLLLLIISVKKTGLIIDSTGITDNGSNAPAGLLLWENITAIKTLNVLGDKLKMIVIDVKNPDEIINSHKSASSQLTAKRNHKLWGSPIVIAPLMLKGNYEELARILQEQLNKWKTT